MKPFEFVGALSVAFLAGLTALSANAEEKKPLLVTVAGSTIKSIGNPSCSAGHESQIMALVLTLADGLGGTKEAELGRWEQASGKPCPTPATRGLQEPMVSGATLEAEASKHDVKTRGRVHKSIPPPARNCWCHSQTFFWSGCYFTRWYDCGWRFCGTVRGACATFPEPPPDPDDTSDDDQ
jgi:hypothetical protein